MPPTLHSEGPRKARHAVVLAHGAGENWDSTFLTYFATGLQSLRVRVIRFAFPYMEERGTTGRRRPPDREPVLRQAWSEVLQQVPQEHVVIGGKSLGGRIASLIADEHRVDGLVCLGYPFHPTGQPDKLRTEHLAHLQTPTLIIQGEQDPFGSREEVVGYELSSAIRLHWVPDGDHSYHVKRGSERDLDQNLKNALRTFERFLIELWPELAQ